MFLVGLIGGIRIFAELTPLVYAGFLTLGVSLACAGVGAPE
jgi:hypothetical protein